MKVIIDIVGLTPRHIGEHTPNLLALAKNHGARPFTGIFPALTLPAQATLLTGLTPAQHGIVGNGWLFRETMEARLWQQSRNLVSGEFFYETAKRKNPASTTAQLFWWFNQGNAADFSLTPKPYYGCDGHKIFGVHSTPPNFAEKIIERFGEFPFAAFWGMLANIKSSEWIAKTSAYIIEEYRPEITLIYLPHLDYDLQRYGASGEHLAKNLAAIDQVAGGIIDTAKAQNAEIIVLSEYGITDVSRVVFINRILREHNLLTVRQSPFGEILETFQSAAFAVADHQIAHIYIRDEKNIAVVKKILAQVDGVGEILDNAGKEKYNVNHSRSGELIALAARDSWFSWHYFMDEKSAPDFAFTIDIHRKCGYDPAELFFDEKLSCPRFSAGLKLLQKKCGLRTKFDLITRDQSRIKGSHGLLPANVNDGAIIIGSHELPENLTMLDFAKYLST